MSIRCASGQALNNATVVSPAYPFTVGCWFKYFTFAANAHVFSFSDTATALNWWGLRVRNTQEIALVSSDSATTATSLTVGAVNTWMFALCRYVSSANKLLAVLPINAAPAFVGDTVVRAPAGIDNVRIGGLLTTSATEYLDGMVGEFWYTNTDVQPDGLAIQASTLRQLAYRGPFSIPSVGRAVVDYRSLKNGNGSNADYGADFFYNRNGFQTWTNVGTVVAGDSPPLNEGIYTRPGSFIRPGIV